MATMILSVVGSDRPGLTQALADAVLAAGGNWLESHLSRLGGLYVGSVRVEVAPDQVEALRATVRAVDAQGLEVRIAPAIEEPGLTGEANWRGIMGGLDKHFGVDASIDEKSRRAISAWLISQAAKGSQYASASPEFRISKSNWFVRQHDEVSSKVWKRASIKSPANCGACHGGADKGDFDEDRVRIPS